MDTRNKLDQKKNITIGFAVCRFALFSSTMNLIIKYSILNKRTGGNSAPMSNKE